MNLLNKINSCTSHISDELLPKQKTVHNSVFFHRDNYCLLELLPVQNLLTKQPEPGEIDEHAGKDFTGNGFLNCACREDATYPLSNLDIDKKEFKALIATESLFFFDTVYTSDSADRELVKDTRGFGFENYVLYYTFKEDTIITCWLDYNPIAETLNNYPEKLQHTLLKLGHAYGLVLIDWNECFTVNLANRHALSDYTKEAL
ncbi:hypothetical protein BEL04_15215 [Mucilaginibacter sp. PPCGB 2223]|uniref:hypothetical protein n=1 Tax=Mucilaginibacter sp. PPCGB 2223 TaxID=1886027 RepID=UPI000825394C|nr:hypothetical protein [Mucilaginibacter sp. PPCGB 2223]OCX51378.1 hypothetical protein BEL04_15215 [Mucilaginibacter sp. PPCGB 2223]